MALGFHMADHGLDGRAAAQFALDGAEHAALLAGDEDAVWVRRVVAAVSLVDIARSIARPVMLSVSSMTGAQCVTVVRVTGQRLGVQHELAARGAGIGDLFAAFGNVRV